METRAYTMRLTGATPDDQKWRDYLWATHEAVNRGAKVFGDWLLTLRGGLDHNLVGVKIPQKDKPDRKPTDVDLKDRRILLALSWLSVESKHGAPDDYIIASFDEADDVRYSKVIFALKEILKSRGVKDEIDVWIKDCSASLKAPIRKDAVWVNRSKAFDDICRGVNIATARTDAQELIWHLMNDYLALPRKLEKKKLETSDEEAEESVGEAFAEAVAKSGKGAGQRTRQVFTNLFGISDKPPILNLKCHWRGCLAEKLKNVIAFKELPIPRSGFKHTELQREMFSKAASRLAQLWTKQKQQELERDQRAKDDYELQCLESDASYRDALDLLEMFCKEQGSSSGSLDEYRIHPRAVVGWDRVVEAWSKIKESNPTVAAEKRIDEIKRLQNEDNEKKLGDSNLFIRLAEPDYRPVWLHNSQSNSDFLKTYVKGWKARADATHLKVAAYRHPDPFYHPVFCQFGVSRPSIKYNRLDEQPKGDVREVCMCLWTGNQAEDKPLLALSNRFDEEIGSIRESAESATNGELMVTRRSRYGTSGIPEKHKDDSLHVLHVFSQQEVRPRNEEDDSRNPDETIDDSDGRKLKKPTWNGTLQADRRELEAIGKLESANPKKAQEAKQHLRWWLIASLELQPTGPWYDYIDSALDKTAFIRVNKSGSNKGSQYISHTGWPHESLNEKRGDQARLILSRLPGLRVLSVDLGHRYAAACAVWETLSAEQMKEACQAKGYREPIEDKLFLHLAQEAPIQKNGMVSEFNKYSVYRRIGADILPDGTPHPAPWARLDRQFLIKLPGEVKGAREATNEEIWAAHQKEAELGCAVPLIDRLIKAGWGKTGKQQAQLDVLHGLGWAPADEFRLLGKGDEDENESEFRIPSLAVDELMSSITRTMRLALQRHGDQARIAYAMKEYNKPMPGNRNYYFTEAKEASANDDEQARRLKHIEYIQDILVLWYKLFSSRDWKDENAQQLWKQYIETLPAYQPLEKIRDGISVTDRNKLQKTNLERLRPVAEALLGNTELRNALYSKWDARWHEDDGKFAVVDHGKKQKDGIGWHAHLRWLQNWLMPSGKNNRQSIHQVGALSLTRLATLTEFRRKVQVGFYTRLHPSGERDEIGEKFGQRALDSLEHLREQRVKQLASRIVEAALGIGSENRAHWDKGRRPRRRIDDARFAPCHAVVIENLTGYRTEETRTRRENRQLMTWSKSKVKNYLDESCRLHGLHLRMVPANYTSLQDSRTGAPGMRCQDVPVKEFILSPFWRKQVAQAEKKLVEGKGDARERFLGDLDAKWKDKPEAILNLNIAVRLPLKSGELFVSVEEDSPTAKGLQADLNAAANIGLRALLDPDWAGKWWYVPCDPVSFKPKPDKVKGSTAICFDNPLKDVTGASTVDTKKKSGKGKVPREVKNLWRDISSQSISLEHGPWEDNEAYKSDVQDRIVEILRKHNGLMPATAGKETPGEHHEQ